jgi:glutamate-ammonia-ligase adenylyltransferase
LPTVSETLVPDAAQLPKPADAAAAARGREGWLDAAARQDDEALAAFMRDAADDPCAGALFAAIFGNSPFLAGCLLRDPAFARTLLTEGPDAAFAAVLETVAGDAAPGAAEDAIGVTLRRCRRRVALLTAAADIAGAWSLDQVTGALSRFADAAIGAAVAWLLRHGHDAGEIALPDPDDPEKGSGLIVLGMGKLGAFELNYSSDIDLILLFDGEIVTYTGRHDAQQFFVRLSRRLIALLESSTGEGYVFRIDLRLRPDPGSTPAVLSVLAAETYYESTGQNWERAAMIKARPIAGDIEAGKLFLAMLRPFVWRKSLDFDAIQDIHSIKRQINAHRGGSAIAVAGHNVKLGRGGIREIEFFAQTQQLIWGGRQPEMRNPRTCEALALLAEWEHIDPAAVAPLTEAYHFLRRVEHRLQMIDDHQTHSVPEDAERLRALAVFLGFEGPEDFSAALLQRLQTVEDHYAGLFEEAPSLSGPGTLVFTGAEDHPGTLETLSQLGFSEPSAASAIVRSWHTGRYRATRSTRARELLTEVMPSLLKALSETLNPDAALLGFDKFLSGLPAGVQLFSLFYSNPGLLALVAEIMGSAPRLADTLRRHPILFDAVLTSDFFEPPPDEAALEAQLESALTQARDLQDVIAILCRHVNDRFFQIGVHVLRGHMHPEDAGPPLSDLADVAIHRLFVAVENEFAERHGRFPGGGMAVVALGKAGGRELTLGSDLDLMFVYDTKEATQSDGERPLVPIQYYTRLGQRFISALTAPTGEGVMYEVDMRLRPSGNAGPIASSLEALAKYHREDAWTWEHMALTRARVVTAPQGLAKALNALFRDVLTDARDRDALVADVADMRERMARERGGANRWDVKNLRGGLVDIEFIAQYLQLRHGHDRPEVLAPNTTDALVRLRDAGLLAAEDTATLLEAMHLWRNVQGVLRLSFGEAQDEAALSEGSRSLLARSCGAGDFDALSSTIDETAARAYRVFQTLIEQPAAALAPPGDPGTGAPGSRIV